MSKNVYGAVFFGSENTANVGWKCIQHYDDKNRAKYNSEKQMKKKAYREALEAVEYQKRYNELFDQQASVENVEQDEVLANVVSLEDLEKKESCDKTNIKIKTEIRDLESPRLGYKKNLISKVQPVERVNKNGEDNKSKQLKIQLYLLEITCSIQTSVSLEKSRLNLDQALSSLQDLQTILDEASGFILLKYPQIVETQMSLCDYIGKTVGHDCWDMKKNEIKQFACKAQLIREIAMVNFQTVEVSF